MELKVTHPQDPGPTESPAKYANYPTFGSADNLFSTWKNEPLLIEIEIAPGSMIVGNGLIQWVFSDYTVIYDETEYTFVSDEAGVHEINVRLPLYNIAKTVRIDVPDVGDVNEEYALIEMVSPSGAAAIVYYGVEAQDYCNENHIWFRINIC